MDSDAQRPGSQLAKRPTLQDVAQAAGVSVMTVSRALRGSSKVTERTRARIAAEAERMGYRPSLSARSLRTGQSNLISIVSPNIMVPLHIEIMQGAREAAAQHGYRLLLQMDSEPDEWGQAFPADGELVMGEAIKIHQDISISRTVSLVESATDLVDLCGTNLPGITREAFIYLHAAGYRRVGFLQSIDNSPKQGWLEAMAQLGLEPDPTLISEVEPGPEAIIEGTRRLLSRTPAPDALVVVHTFGTPLVLQELARQGMVVGRDIGFIGSEVTLNTWGSVVVPGLSMIRIPGYAIGWSGCLRLIERLRGDDSPRRLIQIPSELTIRQSTPGPLAGSGNRS